MIRGMDRIRLDGDLIRRAYADMGLSRAEFAEKADVPPSTLTNITSPSAVPTSRRTAARIAKALRPERTVEDLMLTRPEPSKPRDNRPPATPKSPPTPTRDRKDRQPKKAAA